ncbi:hypothetical protein FQN53_001471 [Emmonsiellopsis sp. PD_33]|nr:hypothetical protein FQN53_001471 [Emmonsiellopsis sp. PD_33]
MLVSRFFNEYNVAGPAVLVLHRHTFMKQYDEHWKDSSKSTFPWLGLLFSILCLSVQSIQSGDYIPDDIQLSSLPNLYRIRAAQCLVTAGLGKPKSHMLEAMILNGVAELSVQRDGATGVGMIIGMVIRASMSMGFHRDPSNFSGGISPFEAEMRRRIWAFVKQMDLLSSIHLGLPSLIRSSDTDSSPPRNLNDEDIGENITEVPPSREFCEETQVSYLLAKNHLLNALASIIEHTNSLTINAPCEYIQELDAKLMDAYSGVPPHLKLDFAQNNKDLLPYQITQSLRLELLYHTGLLNIHKKFLRHVRTHSHTEQVSMLYQKCLDSSMTLLSRQKWVHEEMQPGGRLQPARWHSISPVADAFCLAAVILCLDLRYRCGQQHDLVAVSGDLTNVGNCPRTNVDGNIHHLLTKSCMLWKEYAETSDDAYKIHLVLSAMLRNIAVSPDQLPQDMCSTTFHYDRQQQGDISFHFGPSSIQDMTDNSTPSGPSNPRMTTAPDDVFQIRDSLPKPSFEGINAPPAPDTTSLTSPVQGPVLMTQFQEFDWDAWDSFIEDERGFDDAYQSLVMFDDADT